LPVPPVGPDALTATADAHRIGVEIDISDLVGRLEREGLRLFNDLTQQGVSGDDLVREMQRGLEAVTDAPVDRAARGAVGESVNLGRNLEAQRRSDVIGRVIRTEILDDATCGPCHELDGTEVEINSAEYLELMPPNKCEGREQCRGFYIYEAA
jgi:hypothetical protein